MKEWTVEVYILDEAGKEKPARCFQKVIYNLHPSFENPVQSRSALAEVAACPLVILHQFMANRLQHFMNRLSNVQTKDGASSR